MKIRRGGRRRRQQGTSSKYPQNNIIHWNWGSMSPPPSNHIIWTNKLTSVKLEQTFQTVICKGFPMTMNKDHLHEMFSNLVGQIQSIFIGSDHDYCQVRFQPNVASERVLRLNGWHIKMVDQPECLGQLVIEIPQNSCENRYDFEVQKRKIRRQRRHKKAKRCKK